MNEIEGQSRIPYGIQGTLRPFWCRGYYSMEKNRPTVYQANPLIEGRKPMNALEMRLFLLALQNVNPHISENDKYYDRGFKELHLTPSKVKEIFGHGEYLHRLKEVCRKLIQRSVVVEGENGEQIYYALFGRIRYQPRDGLRIKFNDDMRPLILDILESGYSYTKVSMKQIFQLSSAYAMRLLELMLQYRGMMKDKQIVRQMTLDELRFRLDVQDGTYPAIKDFKRRVLDAPIRDINEKTQYRISYENVKTGRKVTGFIFTMDCSNVIPESAVQDDVALEMMPSKQEGHGLSEMAINKLTTLCGSNAEFKRRMDYALELAGQRKVKDLPAFLYKAIEQDYRKRDAEIRAAVEREMQAAADNAAWEQDALRMFGDAIPLDVEEVPFNTTTEMGRACIGVVKNELQERRLTFTGRRLLEEHGMSVARFIELYCKA